jgi:hypothetical protein
MFIILAEGWIELDTIKETLTEMDRLHSFLKNYKISFRTTLSVDSTGETPNTSNPNSRSASRQSNNVEVDKTIPAQDTENTPPPLQENPFVQPQPRNVTSEYAVSSCYCMFNEY